MSLNNPPKDPHQPYSKPAKNPAPAPAPKNPTPATDAQKKTESNPADD